MPKRSLSLAAFLFLLTAAVAVAPPDFSGTWVLNHAKSRNLGAMAAMQVTTTIRQSPTGMDISDSASFNGDAMPPVTTHYAFDGSPVANTDPTGVPSHTESHWQGAVLVTVWTSPGSVAGSLHRRVERRALSADGRTMTLTSAPDGSKRPPLVMVFDRQ
jgi:hypothetical protein